MCNIMGIEKEATPHAETVILPVRSALIHDLNIPFLAIPMRKLQQSFDERVISDVWFPIRTYDHRVPFPCLLVEINGSGQPNAIFQCGVSEMLIVRI